MVYTPFWFDILDKEGFRESRDISQNRTLLDVSEYTEGADMQTRVDELEMLNQSRNRDKLKHETMP